MNLRSGLGVTLAFAVAGLAWWWWPSGGGDDASAKPVIQAARDAGPGVDEARDTAAPETLPLDQPGGTIRADVRVLAGMFLQWQTNFPATGNPVGSNAEITAALCGENALKLAFIAREHPAINSRGELCDRWGTPFRFHQLSGTEMQIISAGPDRDFATADDVAEPEHQAGETWSRAGSWDRL